ncbi:MAG: hypothetical protein EBR82_43365, partial [Caulobacteraceae bacterium]|nr:hypothetical protein [Caulobacteraceae bacterium]
NNLYELYYNYQFDSVLFMESCMNIESKQFIQEFNNKIKIFIYYDQSNNIIKYDNVINLLDIKHKSILGKQNNIKYIPLLVNKQLYNNIGNIKKVNSIVCFIDHLSSLPADLIKYLYPYTKLPIKLFNNPNIHHHQNLGILSEQEKAFILKQAEYYLSVDEYYAPEASISGCKVLDISELDDMTIKKYKSKKDYQTYSSFMENLLHA